MRVKTIWAVDESHIAYCARVSSPSNQGKDGTKLIAYCAQHHHWSVFEMASMCLEIETTRYISAQLLRHRSFSFQEFSQRYSVISNTLEVSEARLQDHKNRQNSIEVYDDALQAEWAEQQSKVYTASKQAYEWALSKGIAKECARVVMPVATPTRLYMSGTVRSWIHYLQVRLDPSTQKEHRELAFQVLDRFRENYPTVASALNL